MKYRYELQVKDPKSHAESLRVWHTLISSEHSRNKVLANFKTSTWGRGNYNSLEARKARGEEVRIITIEIEERQVDCEEL